MIDYPCERDIKLFRSKHLQMSSLLNSSFDIIKVAIIHYVTYHHFYSIILFSIRRKRL